MGVKTILLVEDNPHDEQLTLRELRRNNLANEVVVARDGECALDLLFGATDRLGKAGGGLPEVVLLDLNLPKIGGLEVLRRLRSDSRTKFLPVIVLTSSSEEQDRIKALNLGVNGYITKPVRFGALSDAVRDLGMHWLLVWQSPFRTRWVV